MVGGMTSCLQLFCMMLGQAREVHSLRDRKKTVPKTMTSSSESTYGPKKLIQSATFPVGKS